MKYCLAFRYGSYYVEMMTNIDEKYPGMRELLLKFGLSVQGQGYYDLKTAADQRGEQTINKDAKTAGAYTI